jgi:hypothetical protein
MGSSLRPDTALPLRFEPALDLVIRNLVLHRWSAAVAKARHSSA